jgi:hypothetical protein
VSGSASICRERGWVAGDVLEGAEDNCVDRIRLDYVGQRLIVATHLTRRGKPYDGGESTWTLLHRDWKKVTPCP